MYIIYLLKIKSRVAGLFSELAFCLYMLFAQALNYLYLSTVKCLILNNKNNKCRHTLESAASSGNFGWYVYFEESAGAAGFATQARRISTLVTANSGHLSFMRLSASPARPCLYEAILIFCVALKGVKHLSWTPYLAEVVWSWKQAIQKGLFGIVYG